MVEIMKQLKAIVQEQNITQRELAKRMCVTETSVSRWLDGSRIPNAKNLEQMAVALGYRLTIEDKRNKLGMDKEIKIPEEKEVDNLRNSLMAIKEMQKQSSYEEDIAKAFQLGLALGLGEIHNEVDKLIGEIKKSIIPQQKMGRWKRINKEKYVQHAMSYYRCSECGKDIIGTHNYCPNCGCKMQGVEDDRRQE